MTNATSAQCITAFQKNEGGGLGAQRAKPALNDACTTCQMLVGISLLVLIQLPVNGPRKAAHDGPIASRMCKAWVKVPALAACLSQP